MTLVLVQLTMSATLTDTSAVTQADLNDPTSHTRITLDAGLRQFIGAQLGRRSSDVVVDSITLSSHRQLRMLVVSGASVVSSLLPYGGANNLPLSSLQSGLTASSNASSSLFTVNAVTAASTAPVCGNGTRCRVMMLAMLLSLFPIYCFDSGCNGGLWKHAFNAHPST